MFEVLTVDALGQVVGDLAVLVLSARSNNARVDTLAVLACLLGRALTVGPAAHTCKEGGIMWPILCLFISCRVGSNA